MSNEEKKAVAVQNEDDDLDGLDDVLDEFSAKPQASSSASSAPAKPSEAQPTAASTSDLQPPSTSATAAQDDLEDADFDEEAFAKELEANMAALMKTFSGMADGGGGPAPTAAAPESTNQQSGEPPMNEEEMMKQFEAMMSEMGLGSEGGGLGGAPPSNTTTSKSATNPAPANYQDALKATMSRLKQSDASASASASGSNTGGLGGMFPGLENDEEMKKLLASLSGGGEGPDGESPEFAKMLENMMGELMGKEILYEPMKELASKYGPFLASPPRELSAEDRSRYETQAKIVNEVVTLFEDPKFESGTEEEKRKLKEVVGEKMNEMQECGAPPEEVSGDMPEGMEGIPGLSGSPEDCVVM